MLSIQFIRQNQQLVREALEKRQDTTALDDVLALDEQRRKLIAEAESLRAHHKKESKKFGARKAEPGGGWSLCRGCCGSALRPPRTWARFGTA